MQYANSHRDKTFIYWSLIKNVSKDIKLRLITLLSQSLTKDTERINDKEKMATDDFLSRFCGSWVGDASAEDIIAEIRNGKTSKDPISFD